MKLLLPKQHGAWAMLLIPFLLGISGGGGSWLHIPLFIGWFFLYLSTYPLLMAIKNKKRSFHLKWFAAYMAPALAALLIPLLYDYNYAYFGLAMGPFFLINVYFARKKNERALLNDISAIAVFAMGGAASYYTGAKTIDAQALELFILTVLFFLGSTFYVKTMIREKKNQLYKWISWGFHAGVIALLILTGHYLYMAAYIPSLVRAISLYGKSISVMKLGVLEIVNSAYFLVIMVMVI